MFTSIVVFIFVGATSERCYLSLICKYLLVTTVVGVVVFSSVTLTGVVSEKTIYNKYLYISIFVTTMNGITIVHCKQLLITVVNDVHSSHSV